MSAVRLNIYWFHTGVFRCPLLTTIQTRPAQAKLQLHTIALCLLVTNRADVLVALVREDSRFRRRQAHGWKGIGGDAPG